MATLYPTPDMPFLTIKASLAISQSPGSDIHSWVLFGLLPPTTENDYRHGRAVNLSSKQELAHQGLMMDAPVDGSHSGHMSVVDGSHSGHYASEDGSHSGHYASEDGFHSGHFAPNVDVDGFLSGHMSNQDGSHSGHMSVVDGSHSGHYALEDGSHSGHYAPEDGSHSGHYAPEDGSHSGHMAPLIIHPGPDAVFNATKASLAISKTEGTDIESWVRTGERPRALEKDYKHKSAAKLISKEKLGITVDDSLSGHMSNMDGSHSGHYSLEDSSGLHSKHVTSTAPSTTGSFSYEPVILKYHGMTKLPLEVLWDEHQKKGACEAEKVIRIFRAAGL